jgi:hypothetical protein
LAIITGLAGRSVSVLVKEWHGGGRFVRNIAQKLGKGLFQVLGVLVGFLFQTRHTVRQVQGAQEVPGRGVEALRDAPPS